MKQHDKLWNEMRFRQKVIRRLYPDAAFRYTHGGFFWDRTQPAVVLVILGNDNSHGVHVDEEMTLLMRAADDDSPVGRIAYDYPSTQTWPEHDHPIAQSNQVFDYLVACACSEDWERDDVQNIYMKMMNKQPLDELAKIAPEV